MSDRTTKSDSTSRYCNRLREALALQDEVESAVLTLAGYDFLEELIPETIAEWEQIRGEAND